MEKKSLIILISAVVVIGLYSSGLLNLTGLVTQPDSEQYSKFVLFADTHYGITECGKREGVQYCGVKDDIEDAVDWTINNEPDFLFHLGDITNKGEFSDFELANEDFDKIIDNTNVENVWFTLGGNHDGYINTNWNGASFSRDRKLTSLWYTIKKGNNVFIFSNIIQGGSTGQFIPQNKIDWLEGQLEKWSGTENNIFILSHTMLQDTNAFSHTWAGMEKQEWITTSNKLKDLLNNYRVDVYITGHLHMDPDKSHSDGPKVSAGNVLLRGFRGDLSPHTTFIHAPDVAWVHGSKSKVLGLTNYPAISHFNLENGKDYFELYSIRVDNGESLQISQNDGSIKSFGVIVPLSYPIDGMGGGNIDFFDQGWSVWQFSNEGKYQWYDSFGLRSDKDGWIISIWDLWEEKKITGLVVDWNNDGSLSHEFYCSKDEMNSWVGPYAEISDLNDCRFVKVKTFIKPSSMTYIYDMKLLTNEEVSVVGDKKCEDGIDNDGDTFIDFPDDKGCSDVNDGERTRCQDGIDNDLDGKVDLNDPNCVDVQDDNEKGGKCEDGFDNDGDGFIDFPDDKGCSDVNDGERTRCQDGIDNDGDGLIDLLDLGCVDVQDDNERCEVDLECNMGCPSGETPTCSTNGDCECIIPTTTCTSCSTCDSFLNTCSFTECTTSCSVDQQCYYQGASLFDDCLTCESTITCEDYSNEQVCLADSCGISNCEFTNNKCITTQTTILAKCEDGIDNDGDTFIDFPDDKGCSDVNDGERTRCQDGIDNDLDGKVDLNDPNCVDVQDDNEKGGKCEDGFDNDGDTFIDFPDDKGCTSPDSGERTKCQDGKDNDGDNKTDMEDKGCLSVQDTNERNTNIECDDGIDNDGDGLIDTQDPDCDDELDNKESGLIIPPIKDLCLLLGWVDNENVICQNKVFCGSYMYPGLRVFDTKEECESVVGIVDCGDGDIDKGEFCDKENLDGNDCEDFGFEEGDLKCNSFCHFDTSECVVEDGEPLSGVCDDGDLNPGEECEHDDILNDFECEDAGYDGGSIECYNTGQDYPCFFDISDCSDVGDEDYCGNNIKESGEQCDGIDLDGKTCDSLGYDSGELGCNADCTFDRSGCVYNIENEDCSWNCLQPSECKDGKQVKKCSFVGKKYDESCLDWIKEDCGVSYSNNIASLTCGCVDDLEIPFFGVFNLILSLFLLVGYYVFRRK